MSKPVLIGLAALLVAATAFFLLLDDGGRAVSVGREPSSVSSRDRQEKLGPADPVGSLQTSAFDKTRVDENAPGVLAVVVVDESDQPVAGATVEFQRGRGGFGPGRGGMRGGMFGGDDQAKPLRTAIADSEGRVVVDSATLRNVDIVARHNDLLGMTAYDSNDPSDFGGSKRVVVKPIKNLEVQVIDTSGSPVPGVRVQANLDDPFNRPRLARQWTADPDGVARLQVTALDPDIYDADEITVAAQLPGTDAVSEKVDMRSASRTIVRVPNVVAVNVVVKITGDDTLPERLNLTWTVDNADAGGPPNGPGGGRGGMGGFNGMGRRDFSGDRVTVAGFKAASTVRFSLGADERITSRGTLLIPSDSKVATYELQLGKKQPYLTMKLIDDRGTSITEGTFSAEMAYVGDAAAAPSTATPATDAVRRTDVAQMGGRGGRGGGNRQIDVDPDGDGVVKIPVDPDKAGTMKFRKSAGGGFGGPGGGNNDSAVLATHPFSATAPGQLQTLPDLRIARPPILVAGIVVDAGGSPVANARVTLDLTDAAVAMRRDQNAAADASQGSGRGGPGGGRGGNRAAMSLFGLSERSDRDGHFEIRTALTDDNKAIPLKVTAQSLGARAESVAFKAGAADVKVIVQPSGSIVGKVRMALAAMKGTISITAAPTSLMSQSDGAPWMRFVAPGGGRARANKDGTFTLRDLKPGTYDLMFSYDGEDVTTVSGFEVKGGEPLADPRLSDLVIGTEAWICDVSVINDDGSPIAGASVTFDDGQQNQGGMRRGAGGRMGFGGNRFGRPIRTDSQGRVAPTFVNRVEDLTVTVRVDQFKDQVFKNPGFPLTVRVSKGATLVVSFALPGGAAPIEGLRSFRIRAQKTMTEAELQQTMEAAQRGGGNNGGRSGSHTTNLDAGLMSGEIAGLEPGTYSVLVSAMMEGRGPSGWVPLGNVVINDIDKRMVFTVTLDAASAELLRKATNGRGRGGNRGARGANGTQGAGAPGSAIPAPPNTVEAAPPGGGGAGQRIRGTAQAGGQRGNRSNRGGNNGQPNPQQQGNGGG